ncbi:MAG TPA: prephenate/arogenate dehydrogenase family protein [Caulobacteraceae bacterium]|nr:prephenate/arogenate dehydrogenase family protein [Caulobacteraceae bacterium]
MTAGPIYERVAIIGCGLIGGSVARAVRAKGLAGEIVVGEREPALSRVKALGLADRATDDLAEAVTGADLVLFAVPPGAMESAARAAAPGYRPGATITDVGSVKAAVTKALLASAPDTVFVIPGHPIAGTEHSGPDAGFATLFENRWVILTPHKAGDAAYDAAVDRLAAFWAGMGANVDRMDEQHHDLVLAVTSHLPHLLAYSLVGMAADMEEVTQAEVMKYSAGGFRDSTRLAASDPIMWRDVFLNNKDAVLEILGRFTEDLQALSRAVRWGEGDKLQDLFTRTRAIRRGIIDAGQETAEPDFGRHHGIAPATSPKDGEA